MTIYKVRRGETVTDVEGFTALVQMAQDGQLLPDDAVFVPASNRWHYARSIRQLREHFALVEDPPPPPGKVREMTREMRESTNSAHDPTEATNVQEGNEGSGGDVVPMRRGRWTPEGKGVQVPVFNYEVDLEPPAAAKPLRMIALIAFAFFVGGGIYVYTRAHAQYLANEAEKFDAERIVPVGTPEQAPLPATRRPVVDGGADTPAPAETLVVAKATPTPTPTPPPTPVPLPSFDSSAARSKVMNASVTAVTRTDQLAPAMRADLIKLAVPVRKVQLLAGKSKAKGPVPFDLVIEYSAGDAAAAGSKATRAKHYWMILSMAGRRASELKLNLRAVTVKSVSANKVVSTATLPADVVKGVSSGSKGTTDVLSLFPDLTKP